MHKSSTKVKETYILMQPEDGKKELKKILKFQIKKKKKNKTIQQLRLEA